MSSVPRWYYYLDHDPRGVLAPGWYAYEDALNTAVETLYQQNPQWTTTNNHNNAVTSPWIPVPMASHSSGFAYQIQFGPHMHVQRNQHTGKQRPIARTTNGMPPHTTTTTTTTSSGTAATAPLAPTVLSASNRPPAIIPSFGAPSTSITTVSPSSITARAWRIGSVLHYRAPSSLAQHHHLHDETAVFEDITNNHKLIKHATNGSNHDDDDDECAICMDELWDTGNHHHHHSNNHPSQPGSSKCANPSKHQSNKVVALKMCQHAFHYDCIKESLTKLGLKCPKCRVSVVDHTTKNSHHHHHPSIQGKCPSGTLTTTLNPTLHCQGFPHHLGTWQLHYSIPNGVQADFHPSPGIAYTGFSSRVAYVPDTNEGRALVARLHYAFGHGVMLVVGTSMTTGQSNVVTWASIHVKTNPTGGVLRHGFPDPDYVTRAHQELDDAGVPHNSQACQQWYDQLLPLAPG